MPFETPKETRDRRSEQFRKVMINAGVKGILEGTLLALVTGWYLLYRHNRGHNVKFFSMPYKVGYFVCWDVVAMTWTMNEAKFKLRSQSLVENQLQHDQYLEKEFYNTK